MPICLKAVSIYVLDIAPEPSLSTISKARLMEILEDFIALKNKQIAFQSWLRDTAPPLFSFRMNYVQFRLPLPSRSNSPNNNQNYQFDSLNPNASNAALNSILLNIPDLSLSNFLKHSIIDIEFWLMKPTSRSKTTRVCR